MDKMSGIGVKGTKLGANMFETLSTILDLNVFLFFLYQFNQTCQAQEISKQEMFWNKNFKNR